MRVILGRYELAVPVASGGMGTLWEGTDRRLNRKIVTKLIRPGKRRDADAMRRFNREARITARLAIQAYPSFTTSVPTRASCSWSWSTCRASRSPTSSQRSFRYRSRGLRRSVAQTCAVLAAAHEQMLVHRDLKPTNVMIRPDGSVKVLDFGLAAALTPGEFSQITRAGELPGTASYMAPEVAEGHQAESASDLYSAGCLLYELLTGTTVFAASDPVAEVEAHLSREPDSVRSIRPEVPVALDVLVCELLAKAPSARPPNASFVVGRLLPSVTDLPILPGIITSATAPNPSQLYATLQERISSR